MNKKQCQTELDIIKNVHEKHLQWGYKVLNNLICSEDEIKVTYVPETRGKEYLPTIYLFYPDFMNSQAPACVLSKAGAYKYIRAGMWRYIDVTIPCDGHC